MTYGGANVPLHVRAERPQELISCFYSIIHRTM